MQVQFPCCPAIAFNLESVDLGDEITSAALVEAEPRQKVKRLSGDQRLALDAYTEAVGQEWDGQGEFNGLGLEPWREVFYSWHTGDTQGANKRRSAVRGRLWWTLGE
jgi:hypothetical protein